MSKTTSSPTLDSIGLEDHSTWKQRWAANHGNFLLAFVGAIGILGTIVLAVSGDSAEGASSEPGDGGQAPPTPTISVAPGDTNIYVRVAGARSDRGSIRLAVYADANHFNDPKKAMIRRESIITSGESLFQFDVGDLPPRFALAAYHDENDDDRLNTGMLGIPSEPYGFSNSARGITGPPPYDDAAVDRPDPGTPINLPIR